MDLKDFESELGNVEFVDLIGPVDQGSIVLAAERLGITLPKQYQVFMERFGSGGIGTESIIGFGGSDHLNFEFMTKLLRSRHPKTFPMTFIPIRSDGYGNYDCIDLEAVNEAGENPIVEWSHDGGRRRVLASDFSLWLNEIMTFVFENQ